MYSNEAWLPCTVTPGQFSCEYAVQGRTSSGLSFSLFAFEFDLELPHRRSDMNLPIAGQIRVQILETRDSLALVRLPQSTLENGDTVTVNRSDLVMRPSMAESCQ